MTTVFRLREVMEAQTSPPALADLARQSGVSRPTCQALYHNKTSRVDLATLDKLAKALGVMAGDLIGPAGKRAKR